MRREPLPIGARTRWDRATHVLRRLSARTGLAGLLLLLFALPGCERPGAVGTSTDPPDAFDSPEGALSTPPPAPTPPELAAVHGDTVVGRTRPSGEPFEVVTRSLARPGHDRRIGRRTFEISLRGSPSTTDACSSCHRPGRPVIQAERIEDAHRYILPRHPEESGTHCLTCHAPDDVESLVLASGERISLSHAYRLCAQCHYAQADDWAAGTHGKRLDGWRGRRVVMGCADCHDPHKPGIDPRIPFPGPQLPGTGPESP